MSVPAPMTLGDMPTTSAESLFLSVGFNAVSGHPLPNGNLPVAGAGLGVVQMTPEAWQQYVATCAAERLSQGVAA